MLGCSVYDGFLGAVCRSSLGGVCLLHASYREGPLLTLFVRILLKDTNHRIGEPRRIYSRYFGEALDAKFQVETVGLGLKVCVGIDFSAFKRRVCSTTI